MAVVLTVCASFLLYTNRSYKPLSFVADGDGYRAEAVNGDTLFLQLNNKNNEIEWFSVMAPEFNRCSGMNATDEYTEFCIIALSEGTGDMGFLVSITMDQKKTMY